MSPLDPLDEAEPKNLIERLDEWWDAQKEGWSIKVEKTKDKITGFVVRFKRRF